MSTRHATHGHAWRRRQPLCDTSDTTHDHTAPYAAHEHTAAIDARTWRHVDVPRCVITSATAGQPCGVYVGAYADGARFYDALDVITSADDDDARRATVGTLYMFDSHERRANMAAFVAACDTYGIDARIVMTADDMTNICRVQAVADAGSALYDVTCGFIGATAGQLAAMLTACATSARR